VTLTASRAEDQMTTKRPTGFDRALVRLLRSPLHRLFSRSVAAQAPTNPLVLITTDRPNGADDDDYPLD
jgi:hypothetical protein